MPNRIVIIGTFGVLLASLSLRAADPPAGDWRFYSGTNGSTKHSPLDQINRENVSRLRIAWRRPALSAEFASAHPQLRLSNNFRATPIMIGGVMYASNGVGLAEAFDPETGRTIWEQREPPEGLRGSTANRGLAYWSEGAEARLFTYTNNFLYALNPRTGQPVSGFGTGGRIDLSVGLGR